MPGSIFWVAALNALQNSMMLRPRCPRAGTIGGAGFALHAGTCSLIIPTIFLAITYYTHHTPPRRGPRPATASALASWIPACAGMLALATPCSHFLDL